MNNTRNTKAIAAVKSEDLGAMKYDVCMLFTARPRWAVEGVPASWIASEFDICDYTVGPDAKDWYVRVLESGLEGILTYSNGLVRPVE